MDNSGPIGTISVDDLLAEVGRQELPVVETRVAETQKDSGEKSADAPQDAGSILSLSDVQGNKGAYRIYTSLIQKMNTVLVGISNHTAISAKGHISAKDYIINEISSPLLHAVRSTRKQLIGFILGGEVKGFEMAKSSVNSAVLSALCALDLNLPHHKLLNIITGALLHDVGMLRLPKAVTEKRGGLSEAELQIIRSHPMLGYKIVVKELHFLDEVSYIVMQHHEHWNGAGYPNHLLGGDIDIGARIVSIADAFEAMVSPKSYRNSITGNQAVKNLLSDNSRRFDPTILKAFVLIMGIYPIGSIVRLNNGAVARISEVRAIAPLRPKVQIIVDENNKIYRNEQGEFLDLFTEKSLYIVKAVDVKEFLEQYDHNKA
jgi:HD-GYP domain-containing protein (c-di-GMP phosphodiesterase class II)